MRVANRLTAPLGVAVAALALGACGGGGGKKPVARPVAKPLSDEQQVRGTIAAFEQATLHGDYEAICQKLLAPALADSVEQYGRTCEQVWKRNLTGVVAPQLQVLSVRVIGTAATARIKSQAIGQESSEDRLGLIRSAAGWRISLLR